jgi:hypothetical protein
MTDARALNVAREELEDALGSYVAALRAWNAPDDEHTKIQLRSLVEQAIEEEFHAA